MFMFNNRMCNSVHVFYQGHVQGEPGRYVTKPNVFSVLSSITYFNECRTEVNFRSVDLLDTRDCQVLSLSGEYAMIVSTGVVKPGYSCFYSQTVNVPNSIRIKMHISLSNKRPMVGKHCSQVF